MFNSLRAVLIATALITLPGAALAECTLGSAPQLPNGTTATETEMATAQGAVKAFLTETQDFLECLEVSSRGLTTADFNERYQAATTSMEKLAGDFNQQIRAFKTRS